MMKPTIPPPPSTATASGMEFNTRVATPYGDGKLVGYREDDGMFIVQLLGFGGTLYCRREVLSRNPMSPEQMEIAFDALEQMRQMNLQIECSTVGVRYDAECCATCLLDANNNNNNKKPQKASKTLCVVCGNPTCPAHQSKGFKKQKVVLCHSCETMFDLDFYRLVYGAGVADDEELPKLIEAEEEEEEEESLEDEPENDNNDTENNVETRLVLVPETTPNHPPNLSLVLETVIQHMLDTYDRVMLLLARDSQYIPELQVHLVQTEARNNHIGAGTSATSAVASILGITGAAMIMTPFGLPILMASLACSCTSGAVSLGNNAVNWYQQPHKAADRILVLHGLACAMLKAAQCLLDVAAEMEMDQGGDDSKKAHNNYGEGIGQGLDAVRNTNTALALSNAAITNSPALQAAYPTTTASLSQGTAWVATVPVLGAALSSIFLVMDASRLQATLSKIQAGNVCEKAETLQKIQGDLLVFPPSTELEQQCKFCLKVIQNQLDKQPQ